MPENSSPAQVMNEVFSATFALYWKTHSYHWNIESTDFPAMHELFGEQYEALWKSLDEIAERMRVLRAPAPNQSETATALPHGTARDAMIDDLIGGHEAAVDLLKRSIRTLDDADDLAGADFLTGRLAEHEKMLWMLRAGR